MRFLFLILLSFLIPFHLGAVPAKQQKKIITLADGTKLVTTFCGDENCHFFASEDGRSFICDNKGTFHEVNSQDLHKLWQQRLRERNIHRGTSISSNDVLSVAERKTITGSKRGLVILVNFPDRELMYDPEEYDDFFNKEGYSRFGMSGSVHDYFYAQSYKTFNLSFDVIGPVTVSKDYSYYGQNIEGIGGRDQHPAEMVIEAVTLADDMVNFSDYDWDNDGYVDQVFVLYAGYAESQAPEHPFYIWPHEWKLSYAYYNGDGGGRQRKDGVVIDTYACSSELRDSVGVELNGIGTACHEFSHCLGLPDLYDTDATDGLGYGMDIWSLMDSGVYGGDNLDGTTPTGFTSYERMFCGWLKPEQLIDPCQVIDMPALSDTPKAYILYNDGNRNEYYLFENRQNTGWDSYLPGHGMLVLHIDYDAVAWANNTINGDNMHQRATIIPADNQFNNGKYSTIFDLAGDTYPGTSGNTSLTDYSLPAALLYNNNITGEKLMGHSITDITEKDGLIGFIYDCGSFVGIPEALEPDYITEKGFTARWTPVDGADYYQVSFMGKIYDTDSLSYFFSGLELGVEYYYKVRAIIGDYFGEWSNTIMVKLVDITKIKDVNADTTYQIFDLQGRRVSCPDKGIYILNGRKVITF
jgi:M6 family metalloprotease-like protein